MTGVLTRRGRFVHRYRHTTEAVRSEGRSHKPRDAKHRQPPAEAGEAGRSLLRRLQRSAALPTP